MVFTDLPENVSYKDKLDMTVTFYGYFLGFVTFPGDVKKHEKDVIAPYFVGKTLEVNRVVTPPQDTSYSYYLIIGAVGIITAILGLTVLLNFWFRRGDRQIESRLADVRDKHHPFTLEPEAPEATPIAEPVKPNETPPTTDDRLRLRLAESTLRAKPQAATYEEDSVEKLAATTA